MPTNKQLDPVLAGLSPRDLCLVTLYGECRGEPIEGQIAVANVIKNRVKDGRWGPTYHRVLGAWAQFSCLFPTLGGLNYQEVLKFAERIKAGKLNHPREKQLAWIVDGLLDNQFGDNTGNATHYFSIIIPAPRWTAPPSVYTGMKGHHKFYTKVK